MSEKDPTKTPTSTNIKIAAKDASQRAGTGAADPGPGDMSAAPSEAPQLVDIPDPPTPSQLVVKSTKSTSGPSVSTMKAATSHGGARSAASQGSSKDAGGTVQDIDEEGEGEVAEPDEGGAQSPASSAAPTGQHSAGKPSSASSMGPAASTRSQSALKHSSSNQVASKSAHSAGKPSSSTSLSSPMEPTTSKGPHSAGKPTSATSVSSPIEPTNSKAPQSAGKPSSATSSLGSSHKGHHGGKKKKGTRFRYHKRVTVRTTGKTSPNSIMSKVNQKDHKAGITPSTIEDMDPQELMKRAGIKASKQTHWRVRLRQTKRLTKNGKTVTQTKVAYRDSEGNKRIKTSTSPFCKQCRKKLEECKCDSTSQS